MCRILLTMPYWWQFARHQIADRIAGHAIHAYLQLERSAQLTLPVQSAQKALWAGSQKIQGTICDKLGAVSASLDVHRSAAARPLSWVPTPKLYCVRQIRPLWQESFALPIVQPSPDPLVNFAQAASA